MTISNNEKYNIRMHGKTNKSQYHSMYRRDVALVILRKNANNGRYKDINAHLMNRVISRIMSLEKEYLLRNGYIELGKKFGRIELREMTWNRGKFKNYAINWDKTLDLWLSDKESKKKKILVRDLNQRYKIDVHWVRGPINNIRYFDFKVNRTLLKQIFYLLNNDKPIMILR